MLLVEPAGGSLERMGNPAPRGMIVHDRTRLIGQLLLNISRIKSGFGQMIGQLGTIGCQETGSILPRNKPE